MNRAKLNDITARAEWAIDYIEEYLKSGEAFDPFEILTGTENKRTKLFYDCCVFLDELDNVTKQFTKIRNKYL